jgi:hypothetical protein
MRAIAILGVLALTACRITGYKDDGTVQPFGGNNTFAIDTHTTYDGFTHAPRVNDDYLWYANGKCSSMGLYMQPRHSGGGMFVFQCVANPTDPNWRKDGGVVTMETK